MDATPVSKSPENPPMPAVESNLKKEAIPTTRIKPLYRGTQIVWYIVGLAEVFLLIRLVLKLWGANPYAGFTQFIYGVTDVFAGPFNAVFQNTRVEGSIFEWSTLLAMGVYALFGWLVVKALVMGKPVTTQEAENKLPDQDKV